MGAEPAGVSVTRMKNLGDGAASKLASVMGRVNSSSGAASVDASELPPSGRGPGVKPTEVLPHPNHAAAATRLGMTTRAAVDERLMRNLLPDV
jgi:hypothetical protein